MKEQHSPSNLPDQRTKKAKGGRPPKAIRRSVSMLIRFTPTEKMLIDSKAKKAGLKTSEWIRSAARSARIVQRLTPEQLGHLKRLSGMANNLNQLTRLAHISGLLSFTAECRVLFADIRGELTQLRSDGRQDDHG
ncbi:MobC family plasmid mobilization relaxosome protein [Mucilaginibacter robiniae]|uniref:MobC family plasmid mobilization relaxosome protein n=1 Tax=Mucilaginibacter robiniae TaxID=2728022 RepID=A0A7L5DX91_9SPHI|nr:plasmid mobilization relaxosome protein MobC [Mucilaginibacter robiniae]QJD95722.1 MobC family plasmid mobilization relaxosome protein [Mucilaginibacter robiniae]